MNYLILYYCVFYLASSGLDAAIVNFDVHSILGPGDVYKSGILTYFPNSDENGGPSIYVFLETNLDDFYDVQQELEALGTYVRQDGAETLADMIIDWKDDPTQQMYKIMPENIQNYSYNNKNDVSIVYNGNNFVVNFYSIDDATSFISTLPSSATLIVLNQPASATSTSSSESVESLEEDFSSLTIS